MANELAKIVVAAGVALVAGLVVGGMGPRAELRALQVRMDAMQEVDCGPNRLPAELAGVLQGRPWEDGASPAPTPRPRRNEPQPETEPASSTEPAPSGDGAEVVIVGEDGRERILSEEDRDEVVENLDMAREAIEIRNRQAWRALDEQVNPTPKQRARIETAVADMNAELVNVADALVQTVEGGEPPERRDMMVFAADALETMIATEDAIYNSLTPEQLLDVDDKVLDPTSYVDASVVDVLQSLEDL